MVLIDAIIVRLWIDALGQYGLLTDTVTFWPLKHKNQGGVTCGAFELWINIKLI